MESGSKATYDGDLTPLEFYDRCVDELKHENDLVNRRMGWLLLSQGLLLGGLSNVGTAALDSAGIASEHSHLIIGYGGFVMSIVMYQSVIGAVDFFHKSLESLHDEFTKEKWNGKLFSNLPQIKRTSHDSSFKQGTKATHGVPIFFAVLWGLVVLAVALKHYEIAGVVAASVVLVVTAIVLKKL